MNKIKKRSDPIKRSSLKSDEPPMGKPSEDEKNPKLDNNVVDVEAEAEGTPVVPVTSKGGEEEDEYPDGWQKVTMIMLAIYLAMLLVALDRTILGTAIPKITDEFHSIDDVGWYAASYLLTSCAFQLIYGRIYTFYSAKWVLLGAIFLFELGSVVCGTAPNSIAFIIGRAIAGLGGSGIFSGAIAIMIITIPLHKRPVFQGIFGAVFGIASICGPLLGGAFTSSKLTWRWCFYINLPIGFVTVLIILLILKVPPSKNTESTSERLLKLDPLGTSVFLPGIVCLLLALQWGGTTYAWSNARIITLFALAFVLLAIFLYIQHRLSSSPTPDHATLPIPIITQRSIAAGAFFSALVPGSMMVMVYYLPIWFQAIKGISAVASGIATLPLVMALVVATIVSGGVTAKIGYYVPSLIACTAIMTVGAGMLTTLQPDTPASKWIAYEFLFGFGLGLGMQQAGMAAQTCLKKKDVMTGVAIMFFFQGLGGAVFIAIAQVVFTHSMVKALASLSSIPNLDFSPEMITHIGATELRALVPPQFLPAVLEAYNQALSDVFKVAVGCAGITIISGLTMEWKSVKGLRAKSKEAEIKKRAGPGSGPEAVVADSAAEDNDNDNDNEETGSVTEVETSMTTSPKEEKKEKEMKGEEKEEEEEEEEEQRGIDMGASVSPRIEKAVEEIMKRYSGTVSVKGRHLIVSSTSAEGGICIHDMGSMSEIGSGSGSETEVEVEAETESSSITDEDIKKMIAGPRAVPDFAAGVAVEPEVFALLVKVWTNEREEVGCIE